MIPVDVSPILINQVYQRIRQAVADCTLQPGQRVRQAELANSLGVSRQPVSHALHQLKREGLVRESGRKGLEVAPIDPVRTLHLYEVRAALDAAAARLAAERGGNDRAGRAALKKALKAGLGASQGAPLASLMRLDTVFHLSIYRLSGNPSFEEIVEPHWPHLHRAMATVLTVPDYWARAWTEHAGIADRVLAGDGANAERLAREHALFAGRVTQERMAEMTTAANDLKTGGNHHGSHTTTNRAIS
jgi:DNA-binding GntR family transcriptional regulator